jgi:hypothetical protein
VFLVRFSSCAAFKHQTILTITILQLPASDKYQIKNYEGEKLAILMKLVS